MEIGGKEIKALASDTRVMIMKSLGERRKMPSELSRELSMAPSTIVEHLHVLESSGLIKHVETGHKWKYYELTEKGKSLVRPKFPVQFVVMLSLGVIMVFGSIASMLINSAPVLQASEYAGGQVLERCVTATAPLMQATPKAVALPDNAMLVALLIGALLIIFAAVKLWSKWK
jgi:DNA-binding transcriptional ArsR family regulator